MTHGNNGFLFNFFYHYFIIIIFFMYLVACVLLKKIYNNNKIMVKKIKIKKLNQKQCSHDAWEQWYFFKFFLPLFYYYIFYVCGCLCTIEQII